MLDAEIPAQAIPEISVIIPVWRQAEPLRRCLLALGRQTLAPTSFEIIVVDNGSSVEFVGVKTEFPHVRWAFETAPGSYAARNHGIRLARAPLLAFTDADCIPEPDWLENARHALGRGASILGGDVRLLNPAGRPLNIWEIYVEGVYALGKSKFVIERMRLAVTANLLVRRSVFETVGVFDGKLMSSGDQDWCDRATLAGFIIRFAPSVVVYHPRRSTLLAHVKKQRRLSGGFVSRSRKYQKSPSGFFRMLFSISIFNFTGVVRSLRPLWWRPDLKPLPMRVRFLLAVVIIRLTNTLEAIRLLLRGQAARE